MGEETKQLVEEARRDALARVIDPDCWAIYDDSRMDGKDAIKNAIVFDSRRLADKIVESGLMARYKWDSREYLTARRQIIEGTSRTGRCEDIPDLLDGYFKHDPRCPHWPDSAIGGSSCIK